MNVDTTIRNVFKEMKSILWRAFEQNERFAWYYAEDCHYVVKDTKTGAYFFIKGKSPDSVYETLMKKIGEENAKQ